MDQSGFESTILQLRNSLTPEQKVMLRAAVSFIECDVKKRSFAGGGISLLLHYTTVKRLLKGMVA